MGSLDEFLADLATSDTKKKLQHGENIINYLGNPDTSTGTLQLLRIGQGNIRHLDDNLY
jgi:hypothetical protein